MRTNLLLASLCLSSILTGCAVSPGSFKDGSPAAVGTAIQGTIHGGSQPISGAHVYLMKVNLTGNGLPSIPLLTATDTGTGDALGGYVISDTTGTFAIPDNYSCSEYDRVYLYATGGSAGTGTNSAAGFLGALADCPKAEFNGLTTVPLNEITTIGTAYALAGFASDPSHFSASSSALAGTSISNAFNMVNNLYQITDGTALTTTQVGNGTVPRALIYTLANILAACIDSPSATSPTCSALLAATPNSAGVLPTDTAQAILNIAHNPGANVSALYALATPNVPYGPSLAVAPNDFTIGITYTGGGLNNPYAVAIDAQGDAWFANLGNSTVSKFGPLGGPLSPAAGFDNGNPVAPVGIAIDLSGNAWIVNAVTNSLTKYASSGALLSPSPGYQGGGVSVPQSIATDALGNVWVTNYQSSASKFSNGGIAISPGTGYLGGGIEGAVGIAVDTNGSAWITNTKGNPQSITHLSANGVAISPASGYIGGGLNNPFSIAIDNTGNAWTANYSGNSLTKFASNGNAISPSTGFTGGGLNRPYALALDGAGNAWTANYGNSTISAFSNTGTPLSPAGGYQGGTLDGPQAIAIDGMGSVWIANGKAATVTQLIGAATPVVTPIAAGIQNNQLAARP